MRILKSSSWSKWYLKKGNVINDDHFPRGDDHDNNSAVIRLEKYGYQQEHKRYRRSDADQPGPSTSQQQETPQNFELVELLFRELPSVSSSSSSASREGLLQTKFRSFLNEAGKFGLTNAEILKLDRDPVESKPFESFETRFQSFIDQISSYLHSSMKKGFFTHFLLGMFSTLLDTRINLEKLNIKRLYYSFDTAETLKIVATIGQGSDTNQIDEAHIFIFSENHGRPEFTQGEWDSIKRNMDLSAGMASIEPKVKIVEITREKQQEGTKIKVKVEDGQINQKNTSPPALEFKQIAKQLHEKNVYLEDYIAELAGSDKRQVETAVNKKILPYIKRAHFGLELPDGVYAPRAREASQHGFVAGVFNNYRYRGNTRIYLEQFAGRGYADIILLVRGHNREVNSIPVVIELKIGGKGKVTPTDALSQAEDYVKGFQPNKMRILTTSSDVLCVGLNLDYVLPNVRDALNIVNGDSASDASLKDLLNRQIEDQSLLDIINGWDGQNKDRLREQIKRYEFSSTFNSKVVHIEELTAPLMEQVLTDINDWDGNQNTKARLEKQITDAISREYYTFPANKETKDAHYLSRYILGQSILLDKVGQDNIKKYMFSYNEYPLNWSEGKEYSLSSSPVTTLVFVQEGREKTAFVLHVREANTKEFYSDKRIPVTNIPVEEIENVVEVHMSLKQQGKTFTKIGEFEDLFKIKQIKKYDPSSDQQESTFSGSFIEIKNSDKLKQALDRAISAQRMTEFSVDIPETHKVLLAKIAGLPKAKTLLGKMDTSLASHKTLFAKIIESTEAYKTSSGEMGKILYPFRDCITNEAGLQAIFNGVFSGYSDLKIQRSSKLGSSNEKVVVIPEFQTGAGGRIDMLVQGVGTSTQGAREYTPVGLELKYDNSIKSNKFEKNILRDKERKLVKELTVEQIERYAQGAAWKSRVDGDRVMIMGVVFNAQAEDKNFLLLTTDSFTPAVVVHSSTTVISPNQVATKLSALCLGSGRTKRSTNNCLFSWNDVNEFNVNKKNPNIDEITIDAQKFLKYTKNIQDEGKNAQLLSLAYERITASSDNIVGEYKTLLSDVVSEGGYENYKRNERIKYLANDFLSSNSPKISPRLKQRLMNAAGRIQLIRGIHGTIVSCKDGITGGCALSVSGLGYSFLSQPIEHATVKIAPKIVSNAGRFAGKFVPRILGHNTKFAIHLLGAKYATKTAKGFAGGLAGIFDIVDIGISSAALAKCTERANTDNPCSDKEIRDNIASISFSSVSFVAGIILTAAGAPLAATGVGLVLMIGYAIYSGVSKIVEYEEKYDTTDEENNRIFWSTFALSDPPRDIQHLAARHEFVNRITMEAWNALKASPNDVVAYAVGLGEVTLENRNCRRTIPMVGRGPIWETDKMIVCDIIPTLHSATSDIHMHQKNANTDNLSRVLPKPIENATMICLPEITYAEYEKGIRTSFPEAVHYCNNAVVVVHNHRKNNGSQWRMFDLRNINRGFITGSSDSKNNFAIFGGNPGIVGGNHTTNVFSFKDDGSSGYIILGYNSTSILDTTHLKSDIIRFNITLTHDLITFNDKNSVRVEHVYYDNYGVLRYIGRKNKVDHVVCNTSVSSSSYRIFIDSGGGYNDKKDLVENCDTVVIRPYTEVKGDNGTYTFYVEAQGYEEKIASSKIHVQGNGTIIFPKISLLDKYNQITYSPANNTLSFEIASSQNGIFTLDVKHYLDENNNTNFKLMDKCGSHIIPQLNLNDNSTTHIKIKKFVLYTSYSLYSLSDVRNHYKDISYNEKDYEVFGVVMSKEDNNISFQPNSHAFFGSSGPDIINLDKDTVFVEGGEGSDTYVTGDINDSILINNESEGKQLDVLTISSKDNISLNQEIDNLILSITRRSASSMKSDVIEIVIENYFLGGEYQHLILVDQNGDSFIPFELDDNLTLLPFYHASSRENVFILPVGTRQAVIDSDLENAQFHRDGNNLLLLGTKDESDNGYPLTIIFKDFYLDKLKWQDHQIYTGSNGDYHYVDLLQKSRRAVDFNKQGNYEKIVKEYDVDFNWSKEIRHNHRITNGTLSPVLQNQERMGVIIFKNVLPDRVKLSIHNDHLIIFDTLSYNTVKVSNWCKSELYTISAFEFDLGLNPIRIGLNRNNCSISYLKEQISIAVQYSRTKYIQDSDGTYTIVLSQIEDNTIIDLRPLFQWIKQGIKEEPFLRVIQDDNSILVKLLYYKKEGRINVQGMPHTFETSNVIMIKLENAFEDNWYEKLCILLKDTPVKISMSNNKLSLISESMVSYNDSKVMIVKEDNIEWEVRWSKDGSTVSPLVSTEHHRAVRAVDQIEENEKLTKQEEIAVQNDQISSGASKLSSPINSICSSIINGMSWPLTKLYQRFSAQQYLANQEKVMLIKPEDIYTNDDGITIEVECDKQASVLDCAESTIYSAPNQESNIINNSSFTNIINILAKTKNLFTENASYYFNNATSTTRDIIYNFGVKDSRQCGNPKYYYQNFKDCEYNVPKLCRQANDLSISIALMIYLWKKHFRKERKDHAEDFMLLEVIDAARIESWQDYLNKAQEIIKELGEYEIAYLKHYNEVLEIRADGINEIKCMMERDGQKASSKAISALRGNLLVFSQHLYEDIKDHKDFSKVSNKPYFLKLIKQNYTKLKVKEQNYAKRSHNKTDEEPKHATNKTPEDKNKPCEELLLDQELYKRANDKYRNNSLITNKETTSNDSRFPFTIEDIEADKINLTTREQNLIPVELIKARTDFLVEAMSAMNSGGGAGTFTAEVNNVNNIAVPPYLSQIQTDYLRI